MVAWYRGQGSPTAAALPVLSGNLYPDTQALVGAAAGLASGERWAVRRPVVAAEAIPSYSHGESIIGSTVFLGLFVAVVAAILLGRRR